MTVASHAAARDVVTVRFEAVCVGITHELAARSSGTAYRARYNRDEMKAHEACVNRNRLGASSGGVLRALEKTAGTVSEGQRFRELL